MSESEIKDINPLILKICRSCLLPIRKNRGASHFAAHGLHVGSGVGFPWAAYGNFAMQIRLPTTSIYGNSGQLSGQPNRQPTASKYEKSGQLSGQRSGLPMGILPCKLGCPLLPYMETVDSGVGCPWAAHGKGYIGFL